MIVDLDDYIKKCAPNVAISTMRAIIKTESKGNPLAINLNKGYKLRYQPVNKLQAESWIKYLAQRKYNIDIGIAQINIKNIYKYGYKPEDALDICTNLAIAADILTKNYKSALPLSKNSHEALKMAISAYNTGNYRNGFKNGYVQKVYKNAGSSAFIYSDIKNYNNFTTELTSFSSKTVMYDKSN